MLILLFVGSTIFIFLSSLLGFTPRVQSPKVVQKATFLQSLTIAFFSPSHAADDAQRGGKSHRRVFF